MNAVVDIRTWRSLWTISMEIVFFHSKIMFAVGEIRGQNILDLC